MVATSATEIARPTRPAGFLYVDMPPRKPFVLAGAIDTNGEVSHVSRRIADESMACRQVSVG